MQQLSLPNANDRLFFLASLTLTLSICFVQLAEIFLHPTRIAAEAAMALDGGRQLWLGQLPYGNCFLLDEPLAIAVRSLPSLLAFILHVHPILLFSLSVLLLSLISAGMLIAILKPAIVRFGALNCVFFMLGYALLTIIFRFEFGQNEHLFVLLFAPYAMARLVRSYGLKVHRKVATIAGVFCLIAVGMASHLWIFFLLFELFVFADYKFATRPLEGGLYRNAPEIKSLLATAVLVCLCLLPVWPTYFGVYLKLLLANQNMFHFDLYYQTLSPDRRDVFYWFALAFVLGAAMRSSCQLLMPLLVNCLIAFILYLLWQDGSSHSLIPLTAFVSLTLAVELGLVVGWFWKRFHLSRKGMSLSRLFSFLLALCIAPSLLIAAWQCCQISFQELKPLDQIGYFGYYNHDDLGAYADVIEKYSRPQEPALVLSFWPRPAYPALLQLHREPASRYLCGAPVRILSQLKQDRGNIFFHLLKGMETKIFSNLAHDLVEKQPYLVLIQEEDLLSEPEAAPLKAVLARSYHFEGTRNTQDLSKIDEAKFHPVEHLGYSYGLSIYKHE